MSYALYEQSTGYFAILDDLYPRGEGVLYQCEGYAGRDNGRNNPALDHVRNVGPIPDGTYRVRLVKHRRFRDPAFRLEPHITTIMHGRSGFLIHGDSAENPNNSSHGCIILGRPHREAVEFYAVDRLFVVPGPGGPEDLTSERSEEVGTTDTP